MLVSEQVKVEHGGTGSHERGKDAGRDTHGTDLWARQGKERRGGFREQPANTRITMWEEAASGGLLGEAGGPNSAPLQTTERGGAEVQEEGDVCSPMPDSC